MTTTSTQPIPRHSITAAAELVEEAYSSQAPDRGLCIEVAQTAAWTASQLIERLFDTTPGVAGVALAQALQARANRGPRLDCGGGEFAQGAWIEADLALIVEVVGYM